MVAPAGTEIELGTVTDALLLLRLITRPLAGAALLIVTVPVDGEPLVTVFGFNASSVRVGAESVRLALRVVAPTVAVSWPTVCVLTACVVIVKFAVVALAGTVTVAGTVMAVELLVRLTETPVEGAGVANVTVPVELVPPTTVVGETVKPVGLSGVRLRLAVRDELA